MDEPGSLGSAHNPFSYATVETINLGMLSGIVFHPRRQTLFAVSDNGHVIEFKPDGTLIQQELIRKEADFEGVTCHPLTGLLYVAVEGDEVILEVNPEGLQVLRDIPIDRVSDGSVLLDPRGNGVEGITFVPDGSGAMGGTFYLVNQSKELEGKDPSIVFEIEIAGSPSEPKATIVRYFSLGITDLSGLDYDPSARRLFVISDSNDLLIETSLSGQISHVHALPGVQQEGIAIDQDGFVYIAQDSDKGLLKLSPGEPAF